MPDHEALIEIKSMSPNARYFLQDFVRNHLQIIAGLTEQHHEPERERLTAIREAVTVMSEDLRRMGL